MDSDEELFHSDLGNDITYDNRAIPDTLRQVVQFGDGVLLNVIEYDQNRRLIFKYYKQYVGEFWNGHYITMITANVYDEEGYLIRRYDLHSNAGLKVTYYEYNWLGTTIKHYRRENDYAQLDSEINTNPFRFLEKITNRADLLKHPKIAELEIKGKKRLAELTGYSLVGKMQKELYYDEREQVSSHHSYGYNDQGLLILVNYNDEDKRRLELEYTSSKELKKALVIAGLGDTSWFDEYSYDLKGRIKQKVSFVRKEDMSEFGLGIYSVYGKMIYQYGVDNAISRSDYYEFEKNKNNDGEHLSTTLYRRNKEGFVTERREIEYRTNESKTFHYKYVYQSLKKSD
ncbi:hypothetical protein [Hymenobacter cellulosilyticus]|uniref:RHS repeat-associated core domain-containing protein n=1 Tax=Hymenobacter cellulosilyticus TaxID=2932248 RepID=A0A8T9PYF5_9BACT|nr:hypothetical protein [Hymenobacter cellulosilyticus]UOQ70097.1 hypothetical protein MUN79_15100 [Hymenobacter cellulosilyticus]